MQILADEYAFPTGSSTNCFPLRNETVQDVLCADLFPVQLDESTPLKTGSKYGRFHSTQLSESPWPYLMNELNYVTDRQASD